MFETWGMDWNGGPYHIGICPECEKQNDSCNDGLCDKCIEEQKSELEEIEIQVEY